MGKLLKFNTIEELKTHIAADSIGVGIPTIDRKAPAVIKIIL